MKINRWYVIVLLLAFLMMLNACGNTTSEKDNQDNKDPGIEAAATKSEAGKEITVTLINKEGETTGTAILKQKPNGVNIDLVATNLPPGTHGFHIHENGVCEAPDFESSGAHINPTNNKHGFDNPEGPHAGDLPNIEVGEDGNVKASFLNDMVTLKKGQENSLLGGGGTSLMIHSKADDYVSQPAGDSGERIACGVIGE